MKSNLLRLLGRTSTLIVFILIATTSHIKSQSVSYSSVIKVPTAVGNNSFDIFSQDNSPTGITFNSDGTKVYMVGSTNDNIHEYNLSIPFDISTAAFSNQLDIGGQETNPSGITFSTDGLQLFVTGTTTDSIYQYNLSVPYSVNSGIYSTNALFIGNEEILPVGLFLSTDGTKMFTVGATGDNVYLYNLTVPNQINSATYSGVFLDLGVPITSPTDLAFNADGSSLFVVGTTTNRVFTFDMSTPYDLGTAVSGRKTFDLSATDTNPQGIAFDNTGTYMFIAGATNDNIFAFDLTDNAFIETAQNNGMVEGSMIITITGDTFTNQGASLSEGIDYTVLNLPSGLTSNIDVATDGLNATMTLSGSAILHDEINDVDDIMITFNNSAFTAGDASGIANALGGSSSLSIDFAVNIPTTVSYSTNSNITSARQGGTFDVSTFTPSPTGVTFSRDGSRMFVIENTNDQIHQFDLSVNFDVTTAALTHQMSIGFEENNPSDITFNTSGTRMYLIGSTNDLVHEIQLDQAFDLSTASFTGNVFNLGTEDATPTGISWNIDGTRLFMIGLSTDNVYQYSVSTPFDINSAVYSGTSINVAASTTSPSAVAFNADGTRMYITGTTSDRLFTYNLTTGFDLSTATNEGLSLNLVSFDSSPQGIYLSENGTKLYMTGGGSDLVHEFDLTINAFVEGGFNDGRTEQELIVKVNQDFFNNAGGMLTEGADYTIDNLPAGLTSAFDVSTDGLTAKVTLSGNAASHDNTDDVVDIQFTFFNTAFAGGNAAGVSNAVSGSSNLQLDFSTDLIPSVSYSPDILVASAVPAGSFDVTGIDTAPNGVSFNSDGSRMYVIGGTNDIIYEFSLSVDFDISTAALNTQLDIIFEENNGGAVTFNPSGTRMYVVGNTSDALHEYVLDNPFDLSSAIYLGAVLDVSGQELTSTGFFISQDGLRMFLIGQSSDAVHQYNLTTAFDFNSATYSGNSFNVSAQTTAPSGVAFSADGTRMFTCGTTSDRLFTYELSTPFEISTAVHVDKTFSLVNTDSAPQDIFIDNSGTRLFMVGSGNDAVYAFDLNDRAFVEKGSNDGTMEGLLNIQLSGGDTFASPGAILTSGVDYTVTNLPAGLVPELTVSTDGRSADLTLSGMATAHDEINDVASLQISYNAATFSDPITATFVNAISSNISLDFSVDILPALDYALPVNISAFIADNNFDITAIDSNPTGLSFNNDGSKMYVVGNTTDNIYQFDLSIPYTVTTASQSFTFNIGFEENAATGIAFNASGTRMYILGTTGDDIQELILSTAFDLSTAVFTGVRLSVASEDLTPQGITFSPDGKSLFMIGSSTDNVYQYDLVSPYDLASASYSGLFFNISTQTTAPSSVAFNRDGTKMFTTGTTSDRLFAYDLGTPFVVSSAVYSEVSFNLVGFDTSPQSIFFDQSGTRFYFVGSGNDFVYPFEVSADAFIEKSANDGTLEGSMIIGITEDLFNNSGGLMTSGTDYSIDNLPAGLIPSMQVAGDGLSATLTLSGNATNHDDADDLAGLQFTFSNSAFAGGNAASLSDAVAANSNLGINFAADPLPSLSYAAPILITTAAPTVSFDFSTEDNSPTGFAFSNDGLKLFMIGNTTDRVYEYNLSSAFDVTSASLQSQLDLSFEENNVTSINFNPAGTRMYLLGTTNDDILEYVLLQPFDLTTASFSGNRLAVGTQDLTPNDFTFSSDGLQIFIVGSSNDALFQYNLVNPYDLNGATFSGNSLAVGSVLTSPTAFSFNPNGTKLFVVGNTADRIFTFNLTSPFDITTAVNSGVTLNVVATENSPFDFIFSQSGTEMYLLGNQSDQVHVFELSDNAFIEKGANDGTVEGSLLISITEEVFLNAGGTLTAGTDYNIDNLPAGLIPTITVAGDGLSALLTLSGIATVHDDVNDVDDLQLTFSNSAFAGGDATGVENAISASSNLKLDFAADINTLTYATTVDVSTAVLGNNFNLVNENTNPTSIYFNNNGSKMFVTDNTTNTLNEYVLSVRFDVATAVFSTSLDLSFEENGPGSIAFNTNGTRLYVVGSTNDSVREFIIDQPFDISTAAYSGVSFDVSAEEISPTGISFSPEGLQMFIVGSGSDNVYAYDLSAPFELSSASYSGNAFNLSAQITAPSGIAFNANGTKMFVTGTTADQLFEYTLSTGFDIATAVLAGSVLNFTAQDTSPNDLFVDQSGTRLFMVGSATDSVYTYQMSDIAFAEVLGNDGSVSGKMLLRIYGDKFSSPGTSSADFTIDNLPSGLIPDLLISNDGYTAELTLSGNAIDHAGINDISDLMFTFNNNAFVMNDAPIQNSVSASSNLQVDFFGPAPPSDFSVTEFSDTQIDLNWVDQSADEDEFAIFRSTGNNSSFVEIATTGADINTFGDLTVTPGNSYFYFVIARNAIGDSSPTVQKAGATLTDPGNALAFDGIDDHVVVSSLNAPSGSFTLEAWVRYGGTGTGLETIIEFGQDNPLLGLDNGILSVPGNITAPKDLIRNVWVHVAVSYDQPGQDMRLYINGQEVAQASQNVSFTGSGMGIGHFNGDGHFPGLIDEVRIWEVARTETELQGTLGSELVGNEFGLVAYYKFDQTSSGFPVLPDRSLNAFDGTLTNFDFNGINNGSDWNASGALAIVNPGPSLATDATVVTPMQFTANWNLEPGIIDYVLDVSTDDQFTQTIFGFDNQIVGNVNTQEVTGLEYGTNYFYRVRGIICPGDTTGYSNTITVKTATSSGTIADSVALVRLYNELGGIDWTNNTNWLSVGQRIENWFGVTLLNGRVVNLDLQSNNLTDSLSEFTGEEFDQLTSLLLNGNALTGLPNLTNLSAINDLQVQNNNLSFQDLEMNSAIPGIAYIPQAILLDPEDFLFNEGENVVLERTVGGINNVYEWTKDATIIAGETAGTLDLEMVSFADEGLYEVIVTNVNVPGLTLNTNPITVTISSLEKDSLALVAIFNSTGGDSADPWINRDSWLSGPITSWEGLGFTGNRVTTVDLDNSNMRGAIPVSVLNILNLETLILSNNKLDSIPDLTTMTNLSTLNVSGNQLQFDDMEANVGITNFTFADQVIPGEQTTSFIDRGTDVTLSVDVKGAANLYQWQFNGMDISGANSSAYIIQDLAFDEMGVYECTITNSLLPSVTLTSPSDSVLAISDVSGAVTGINDTPIASGTVLALRITENNTRYDSITPTIDIVNGAFTYPDLTLGDYLFVVEADESIYIPTYAASVFLWDEADTTFLRDNDQTANVSMVLDPDASVGAGAVGGIFEEEFPDEGRIEARRRVRRVGVALRRRRSSGRVEMDDLFELIAYTQTDDEGQFTFENLPSGVYRISFEFPGVPLDETSFVEFEISEDDDRTSIQLEAVATEDGTIVVTDVTPDPVDVKDRITKQLSVYPNPANNVLTIDYRKITNQDIELSVTDGSGRRVLKSDLKNDSSRIEKVDISSLHKGIYFLQFIDLSGGKSLGTIRFMKID